VVTVVRQAPTHTRVRLSLILAVVVAVAITAVVQVEQMLVVQAIMELRTVVVAEVATPTVEMAVLAALVA
jgi:hypothetical protein